MSFYSLNIQFSQQFLYGKEENIGDSMYVSNSKVS